MRYFCIVLAIILLGITESYTVYGSLCLIHGILKGEAQN